MTAAKKTRPSSPIPRSPFRDISSPAVAVTGASSGIGAATALELSRRGFFVFGCVRKLRDADALISELGPTRFSAVEMDVCDVASVYRAAEFVGEVLVEGKREEGWREGGEEDGAEEEEEEVKDKKQKQRNQKEQKGAGGGGESGEEEVISALGGSNARIKKKKKTENNSSSSDNGDRSGSGEGKEKKTTLRARSDRALLSGLVNCSGVAIPGPLLHQPLSEIRTHMEVNFFGVCCVTRAFAPLLGAGRGEKAVERKEAGVVGTSSRDSSSSSSSSPVTPPVSRFAAASFPVTNPGTIVQISSTAGKLSAPFIGAYAASKHALEAASDSLRRELVPYGVDVLVVEPGAVATPIWDKAEHHDVSAYDETPYRGPLKVFGEIVRAEGRAGHSPQRIARIVAGLLEQTQKNKDENKALFSFPPPTRTTCVFRRIKNWTLPHLLPDRASDLIVAALLGMLPGPFFRNAEEEKGKGEEGKKVVAPAVVASEKKKQKSSTKKRNSSLAFARRAVAAVAFVSAVASFAWRVASSRASSSK